MDQQPLEQLQEIKNMMERSSRFLSLSGWSGVSAGVCALTGAYFAHNWLQSHLDQLQDQNLLFGIPSALLFIASATFLAALASAIAFTYNRSRNNQLPIWNASSKRLVINVLVPMAAGGIFLLKIGSLGHFWLIAPGCLLFYGLGLLNGSKYTLGEIRYLAYFELVLGLVNLWFPGYGLYFWAAGFGVLHIIYGIIMWNKYERVSA